MLLKIIPDFTTRKMKPTGKTDKRNWMQARIRSTSHFDPRDRRH
jgi:hypothetical protein